MLIRNILLFVVILLFSLISFSYIRDRNEIKSRENTISYKIDNTIDFPFYEKQNFIPKVIHRNYGLKDDKSTLEKYSVVFEKTKKICPEFKEEIIFGKKSMEEFILKYYNQDVLDIIELLNYNYAACVSDILRLLVIYAKGGIYLDIKSHTVEDLTPELEKYNDKFLCSYFCSIPFIFTGWTHLPPYGEISNWFFAAPKGHPIVRELILQSLSNVKNAYLEKEKFKNGRPYILSLTGPYMFTKVIKNSKFLNQVKLLGTFSLKNIEFSGWRGKLKKETREINNSKIQNKTHWKHLQEPLFKI